MLEMDPMGTGLTDRLTRAARDHGLTEEEECPFLLWLGNEIWDGRAEAAWPALMGGVGGLVRRFKADGKK